MDLALGKPEMLVNSVVSTPRKSFFGHRNGSEDNELSNFDGTSPRKTVPVTSNSTSTNPLITASRRRMADPEVIEKVEEIVDQIIISLQQRDENISIALKTKKSSNVSPSSRSSVQFTNTQYKLSFPGNTRQEAWRFSRAELKEKVCSRIISMLICSPAVVLRVLELIHEALVNNMVISKRNIYYQDVSLFKSQKVVDRYVDILSYTFGIPRASLNVVSSTATAKGLVAGSFKIIYHDSSTYASTAAQDGKGYPDVSTRAFLRILSISAYPPPPIYTLVDFDPDGISIMSTYKYGSLTLSHQAANINTPIIRWLGVKSQDLVFHAPVDKTESNSEDRKGLLGLSKRDRKKAASILGQEIYQENGVEQEWRRELQMMLMLNVKVEMEILSEREGGISGWLDDRLREEALTT
ncbi:MAG: hypothetical protein Q9220_004104 [cf. Caloplaca sp. 1 TL-2023]